MTLTKKQFEALKQELEIQSEEADEYVQQEDSIYAEYAADFGYGDGRIDLDAISPDMQDTIKTIAKSMSRTELLAMLIECCELTYVPNMYTRDNELYSVIIGETEHQLSDEAWEQYQKCSGQQFGDLQRYAGIYSSCKRTDSSGMFYGSHDYERWAMIFDGDRFDKWTLKNKPKIKFTKSNATIVEGGKHNFQPAKPIGKLSVAS